MVQNLRGQIPASSKIVKKKTKEFFLSWRLDQGLFYPSSAGPPFQLIYTKIWRREHWEGERGGMSATKWATSCWIAVYAGITDEAPAKPNVDPRDVNKVMEPSNRMLICSRNRFTSDSLLIQHDGRNGLKRINSTATVIKDTVWF